MKTPKIKICGITCQEDAEMAERLGADYLGLVFTESRRRVTPHQALEITRAVSPNTKIIGVFVNESIDDILRVAEFANLTGIQLHGDESTTYVQRLKLKSSLCIIKAVSVDSNFSEEQYKQYDCDYFLFDSPRKGGMRSSLNTTTLVKYKIHRPFFIAGGLTTENVAANIGLLKPFGVDVSSSIETSSGRKDSVAMKSFFCSAQGVFL